MRIVVTKEHIDKGAKGRPESCAVALAMLDAGYHRPRVDGTSISWTKSCAQCGALSCSKGGSYPCMERSPTPVRDFISKFDRGETVEPFEFYL